MVQAKGSTKGVICVLKGQTFEFSELRGIKPSSTDSFVSAGNVIVLHGDYLMVMFIDKSKVTHLMAQQY